MPLLRTITLLAKTVGQSVEAYPCNMVDFDGNLTTGAAGLYLQFHNKASAPVNTDVPIKSFYIAAAGSTNLASIFQLIGPLTFSTGLAVGISSTDATYTAATATFDLFIDIEENFAAVEAVSGLSTVTVPSDMTLTIYSGSATKRTFSLTIVNGEGVIVYPMIFSPSSLGVDGSKPFFELPPIAIGATANYYFGREGLSLPSIVSASVVLSSTPTVLTGSVGFASTLTAKVKT